MVKTQVITEKRKKVYFPILMESITTDKIVLFTSEKKGTVVRRDSGSFEVGYYSDSWLEASNPKHWKVFEGE